MDDLTRLSHQLDVKQSCCRAIIETPRGSRNKLSYHPETKLFRIKHLLPKGMSFPFDFGFIPSTLGADGDPLDILVLMDEPAPVAALVEVRLIGIIKADQTESGKTQENHRLLGVAIPSYDYEDLKSIDRLNKQVLSQIEEFFITYNRQYGKEFKVTGTGGPKEAIRVIIDGSR